MTMNFRENLLTSNAIISFFFKNGYIRRN